MPTIVFIALCASLVVGVMLVWIGRRGRKLNDHPVCRWCGFDVSGTYPASYMCPECGGGLKREHGVRIGVRKRMPTLIILGALLVLLPLAPMGIAFYGVITGANLNKWKPVGVLLWEADRTDTDSRTRIVHELLRRVNSRILDDDTERFIADDVLGKQADRAFGWSPLWGDLFEFTRSHGNVSESQLDQFRSNSVLVSLKARRAVHPGESIPFALHVDEQRSSSTSRQNGIVWLLDAALSGRSLLRDAPLPAIYVYPAALGAQDAVRGGERVTVRVTPDQELGEHLLEAQIAYDPQAAWTARPSSSDFKSSGAIKRVRLAAPVRVVALSEPLIVEEPFDEATQRWMEQHLAPRRATVTMEPSVAALLSPGVGSHSYTLRVEFVTDPPPIPFAYKVIIKSDGIETEAGEICSDELSVASNRTLDASLTFRQPPAGPIDVILRASSRVAARSLGVDRYYGGTVEFKRVSVVRRDARGVLHANDEEQESSQERDGTVPAADR